MAANPGFCASCGLAGEMHEHHIVPRAQGGLNLPTVFLCVPCHGAVHSTTWDPHHARLIREGLAASKAAGKTLGRKRVSPEVEAAITARLEAGVGMIKIAKELGIGTGTVQREQKMRLAA